MLEDCIACPPRCGAPALIENIAPYAAREAHPPFVAVDEAAIPARKSKKRHDILGKIKIPEMCLEGEQLPIVMAAALPRGERPPLRRAETARHGCQTWAPARAAPSSNSKSNCSRPRALPHPGAADGKLGMGASTITSPE